MTEKTKFVSNRRRHIAVTAFIIITTLVFQYVYFTGFDFSYKLQTSYHYPAKPGTTAWIELKTTDARRLASDIDQDIVKNMSTMALIKTVVTYPLFTEIYAFGSPETGIAVVSERFTGLSELLSRPDTAKYLSRFMLSKSVARFILPSALSQYTRANTLLDYLNNNQSPLSQEMNRYVN